MSGIELVGLAASVLQIADLGWKVSYRLYAFSTRVHEASKTIELISQDISATGAILKQLGDAVKGDEEAKPDARLCSQGLIDAASKLVEECNDLFKEIDLGISGSGKDGNKVLLGFRQKLKWSYLGPRVELLRMNLERLKSSLAIMLNVLIYAEQLRSREEKTVLVEQQTLVATFAIRKANMEKKIADLDKNIAEETATQPSEPAKEIMQGSNMLIQDEAARERLNDIGAEPPPYLLQTKADSILEANVQNLPTTRPPASEQSSKTSRFTNLEHHRRLIEKLLEEVNSTRYAVDHGVRYRLHDGVLDLHWQEWSPLRPTHGDEVLRELLAQSPTLARHWHERISKTGGTQIAGAIATATGSVERQRSKSPRVGRSRSRGASKVTKSTAIVATGLGAASKTSFRAKISKNVEPQSGEAPKDANFDDFFGGSATISDVHVKNQSRSRVAGAREEEPSSRSRSRPRNTIHRQNSSSSDDQLPRRLVKRGESRDSSSLHDVSGDDDDYANVDISLLGGGYAGNLHYGEQKPSDYPSAAAAPSNQFSEKPNPRIDSLRGGGAAGERDSQTSRYRSTPRQDASHPFLPLRTEFSRAEVAGTAGPTEPSPHPRRLHLEDGGEDSVFEIDTRLSGAINSSRDSFPDLFYHPGMSPQRPLPPAPSGSGPGGRLSPLMPAATYVNENRLSPGEKLPTPYPSATDTYLRSVRVPTQAPRSTSLSSMRSAPKPDQPTRAKTNAEARARLSRTIASSKAKSKVYEVSTPSSAAALEQPTIPRKNFDPSKISTEQFKKCSEPWALSSVVAWLEDLAGEDSDLKERTIVEAIVALFKHRVPTMNTANAEMLGDLAVKEMVASGVLVKEKEWVNFGTGAITGVLFQLTGTGCYSSKLHLHHTRGRCYSCLCMRMEDEDDRSSIVGATRRNTRMETALDTIADFFLLQWTTVSPTSVSGNL